MILYNLEGMVQKLKPNTTYTLSFEFMSDVQNNCYVTISKSSAVDALSNTINFIYGSDKVGEWVKFTLQITTNSLTNSLSSQYLYFGRVNTTGYRIFKNLKLEEGVNINTTWTPAPEDNNQIYDYSIEYDTSGYCNNGSALLDTCPLAVKNNSPRYDYCYYFNGISSRITSVLNLDDMWSCSIWFKYNTGTGWKYLISLNTDGADVDNQLSLVLDYSTGRLQYTCNGDYFLLRDLTSNIWYFATVTFDGITRKCYLNGELQHTSAITNKIKRNNLTIGARKSTDSYANFLDGYLSDLRIYATALSQDAITDLYKTSQIANTNSLLTYGEIIEE